MTAFVISLSTDKPSALALRITGGPPVVRRVVVGMLEVDQLVLEVRVHAVLAVLSPGNLPMVWNHDTWASIP